MSEASRITVAEFNRILSEGMPAAAALKFDVVSFTRGAAVLRSTRGEGDLRPGGTVSGPALFSLADLAMYAAVLTAIGPVPLAVTTDATIHFLRKPRAGTLVASAKLLKVGKRLVVGEVVIAPDGEAEAAVLHGVMTYSVP